MNSINYSLPIKRIVIYEIKKRQQICITKLSKNMLFKDCKPPDLITQ